MRWVPYAALIGVCLLLAGGGVWQGLRPDYVTRKRQEIAEQMGRSGARFTRFNAQLSGYLAAAVAIAGVVVGTVLLVRALTGGG